MRSYGSSQKDVIALKEEDMPIFSAEVESTDYIVYISNQGRYGVILVHDIEEARWRDVGSHLNQYVKFEPNESLISAFVIKDFDTYRDIVTVTSNGMLKKSQVLDLEVKRTNRMYDIMKLDKGATLVGAHIAAEGQDVLLVSKEGRYMRLDLDDINPIGLKGKGVIAMKLKTDDIVVASAIIGNQSEAVFMSHKFQFKRIKTSDLIRSNRATQGLSMMREVKSNPNYIDSLILGNIQDVISLYNDKLVLINFKDVTLMSADQAFSTITEEGGLKIIQDRVEVPKVNKPKVKVDNKIEAMKFDI